MSRAKFVQEVMVTDPDTLGEVEVSIFKHQNGGMFGIDSSYIDQVLPEEGVISVPDPFNDNPVLKIVYVILEGV